MISQYFIGGMMPESANPVQQSVTVNKQLTGMRGVYLVAAELSGRGFIASPTARSAREADIFVHGFETTVGSLYWYLSLRRPSPNLCVEGRSPEQAVKFLGNFLS